VLWLFAGFGDGPVTPAPRSGRAGGER